MRWNGTWQCQSGYLTPVKHSACDVTVAKGERMRIALIADIHGNLIACATVLQGVAQNAIEQIIRVGTASGVSKLQCRVVCFCQ
jgi:hypothetical protein